MMKVLVQVVAVFTLVFGTCYQSVLALANDTRRVDLTSVQLNDKNGAKVNQVKVGEEQRLAMTVTISNKDGDQEDGSANLWLPENQLEVLKAQVKAEAGTADTNAKLYFERRRDKTLRLRWEKVATQMTFKLDLPVKLKTPMTAMALPVAVGSVKTFAQPVTVVAADTDDEALAEAGSGESLPVDLLAGLNQFVQSEKLQEQQAAEKAKEAETATENEVADEVTKDKNEADNQEIKELEEKEKKVEQDKVDQENETAKTKDTLEKNNRSANAKADTDGKTRENDDDEKNTRPVGSDLGKILAQNGTPTEKSFFNRILIQKANESPIDVTEDGVNVTNLSNFDLTYEWNSETLIEKLKNQNYNLKVNDYHIFQIKGLEPFEGEMKGEITAKDADTGKEEVFATWEITQENDVQSVKIVLTNAKMLKTNVEYDMTFKQTYKGPEGIDFEFNDEAIWTITPDEEKTMLTKVGKFVENNQIKWTIDLDVTKTDRTFTFKDISLQDVIAYRNELHTFSVDDLEWDVYYKNGNGESLRDKFNDPQIDLTKMTITSESPEQVEDSLVFTFRTKFEPGTNGEFWNKVSGQIGENLTMKETTAYVSNANTVGKSGGTFNATTGEYSWNVAVDLAMVQYQDDIEGMLGSLKIIDAVDGPHSHQTPATAEISIGETKLTDYFDKEIVPETGNLVISVNPDSVESLANKLREILNKSDSKQIKIDIAYKTIESGSNGKENNIANVSNKVTLEIDNKTHATSDGKGSGNKLVTKTGSHDYSQVDDGNYAKINWEIEANNSRRAFETLEIIDVLPSGLTQKDIAKITVNIENDKYDLLNDNIPAVDYEFGHSNGTLTDGMYDFSDAGGEYAALKLSFKKKYSGKKIQIIIETKQPWSGTGKGKYTNLVSASLTSSKVIITDQSSKDVEIEEKIQNNAYKDAELKLANNNPNSDKHTVKWTIGFGSQLNDQFGPGTDEINSVSIKDWLNEDNQAAFLSFPNNKSDFALYLVDKNFNLTDKISTDDYDINWEGNHKTNRTFTITFKKLVSQKDHHLALVFETPIDLNAWNDWAADQSKPTVPKDYMFYNHAQVTYEGREAMNVSNHASLKTENLYGKKSGEVLSSNKMAWKVVINANSSNIGNPKIVDTLGSGHIHDIDPNTIELAYVDINRGNGFDFDVDKDVETVAPLTKDQYTVSYSNNYQEMTIQVHDDVKKPLMIKYQTIMQTKQTSYNNSVKISASYYNTTITKTVTVSANAFVNNWSIRFKKVDGDTKEPLAGVKFQLQEKQDDGTWAEASGLDDKPYGVVTSLDNGFVQFDMLGTLAKYRLVEVGTPDGYDTQMQPIEFSKQSAVEQGWLTNPHMINNFTVKTGSLAMHKITANLPAEKQFDFVVTVYGDDTNIDTHFNGRYKLDDGTMIKFTNGQSEPISMRGGEIRTLSGLPTQGINANEERYDRQYSVEETTVNQEDFRTEIAVDDEDYKVASTTDKFKLNESTSKVVTVKVRNTAAKGDLNISKQVSSGQASDHTKAFQFTVKADSASTAAVANKTFKAEGVLKQVKFDSHGELTFELKDGQYLQIKDLPEKVQFNVSEVPVAGMETATSVNAENFKVSNSANLTTDIDQIQTIVFKNSREASGQLRLTKRVAGAVPEDKQFEFKIKASTKFTGKYQYSIYNLIDQDLVDTDGLDFVNGEAKLSLKGNQYILIYGLPLATEYQVDESLPQVEGMLTSWETSDGMKSGRDDNYTAAPVELKSENDFKSVTFNNELPNGELTIGKKVTSNVPGDHVALFDFVVKADNSATIQQVGGNGYSITNYDGSQLHFDQDGQALLSLKADQTVTISGLPAGASFTVSESPKDVFKTTYQLNQGQTNEQNQQNVGPTVEIKKDTDQTVIYTNTRRGEGELLLTKIAKGAYPTTGKIIFTIRDSHLDLNETFKAKVYQSNGNEVPDTVTFTDGVAEVSLEPGNQLLITGLPEQAYKITEEKQADNVVTTSQVDLKDSIIGVEADWAVVKAEDQVKVTFTNQIETGQLTLNKFVNSSDKADLSKRFEFEVRADDADKDLVAGKQYTVENHPETEKVVFNDDGIATITLKDQQTATIKGLPAEVKLTVVETQAHDLEATWNVNNEGGYQPLTPTDRPQVEITFDETETVSYQNDQKKQPPVGHLRVDKVVTGADKLDATYQFEVQATISDNKYAMAVYSRTTGEQLHSRPVEFKNGLATLNLKADQYAIINGLPLTEYQVSEIDPDVRNMVTTWSVNNGDSHSGLQATPQPLAEDHITNVTFNNRIKTGTLVVEKQVKGTNNLDQSFEFTIAARRRHQTNTHFNGDYTATFTRQDGTQTTETVTFKDGQLKVNLKHGDKVQLNHLPTGVRFKVSEQKVDRFDATYQVDGGEQQDHQAGPTIKIKDEKQTTVRYTNTWQGDGQLLLEKIAAGDYPTNTPIDFEITAQDDLNGTFAATYTQANGHEITKQVPFEAGQAKVTFMPGERLLIKNLSLQNYTVTEAKQADRVETTWQVDEQKGEGLTTQPIALKQGHTSHVTYTNLIKSGSVIVEKQVTGAMVAADLNRQFEFTLAAQREVTTDEVDDSTTAPTTTEPVYELDKLFEGDYKATLTRADGEQVTQTVTFEAGQLVTKLRAGERLQIKGLPEEQRLIISETPEVEFITTHQVNGGEVTAGHETTGITTSSDQVQRVTFMNDRPVTPQVTWLALTKSVLGEAGEKDRAFNFNVYLHDHVLNPITGTVQIIKTTAAGISETGQLMLDENGAGQVALQHGETVRIELPDGAHYQIVEDDYTSDGYVTTTSQGANPVREGTTVTGVVSQSQPNAAKVVYYNRADPVTEDQPHTDTDDDETTPDFVGPATEDPSDDLEGSALPQAHTSTGTGSGTTSTRPMSSSSKGFLPQTGEFLKDNWLMVLGLLILVTAFGVKVTLMKKRK